MFLKIVNFVTGIEQTTYIGIGAGSGVALILLVVLVVICLRFVNISFTFDVTRFIFRFISQYPKE